MEPIGVSNTWDILQLTRDLSAENISSIVHMIPFSELYRIKNCAIRGW